MHLTLPELYSEATRERANADKLAYCLSFAQDILAQQAPGELPSLHVEDLPAIPEGFTIPTQGENMTFRPISEGVINISDLY